MGMAIENGILGATEIAKTFSFNTRRIDVLKSVNLSVKRGEFIGIVGASGTGKSTLLHILGGLDRPTGGNVRVDGVDIFSLGDNKLSALRGSKIGFVFQFHHLLPEFTALENVLIPSMISGAEQGAVRRKAEELFDFVGLSDRMEHRPGKLSGGEQQRVAIVRALINDPDILLADEPTGNLDEKTANEVFDMVRRLASEKNLASIVVTHNNRLADSMDMVYELHEGQLHPKGK